MTNKYDDIRDSVTRLLATANVSFTVRYVGPTKKQHGKEKPWPCDAWRFTLKAGSAEYSGDYFTGLGHRKVPPEPKPYPPYRPGTLAYEDWQKTFRPQAPHAADVLHSLVLDSTAADMCFADWCSDYGYSDDSISALETYRQCCNAARDLRRVFKADTLAALRDAVQDL